MLIRAFAQSGIDGDLVILGEGEEREALIAEGKRLGLAGRLKLPGFLENPYPIIAGARIYASSSNAEGFPNAIAEAMVLGRPVVATDCPSGPAELLQGNSPTGRGISTTPYGVLVPVEDTSAFAEALKQLHNEEIADELGSRAATRMQEFDATRIAARYASFISSS